MAAKPEARLAITKKIGMLPVLDCGVVGWGGGMLRKHPMAVAAMARLPIPA